MMNTVLEALSTMPRFESPHFVGINSKPLALPTASPDTMALSDFSVYKRFDCCTWKRIGLINF